jgi:HlyD family secretion protein
MKHKRILAILAVLAIAAISWYFISPGAEKDSDLLVAAKKGRFEVVVSATGELEAKNSVRITGPAGMQAVGMWQVKISDLVAEGSVVKKGDYIAMLDKTEIVNKLKERETELQKAESQYTQTQLDTTLTLREARDNLINLKFAVTEKEIVLEQSKYEPPATIRQAEIEMEKAQRAYEQAKENYAIKKRQAAAKMQEAGATLAQNRSNFQQIQDLMKEFTVTAPEGGMVIYSREWNGRKKTAGSNIYAYDPTVATLPDLSVMLSKTYVNEVDIRKIKKDQVVRIGLDAFPEKKLSGIVTSVANVGEQQPNSDAKVFEVNILVNESDTTLRPAMTTSNNVVASIIEDVLYIPLESLHNQGDSLTYVFKKSGASIVKQEIKIGQTNDNEAVVLEGLQENEMVYLSVPQNAESKQLVMLPKPAASSPITSRTEN